MLRLTNLTKLASRSNKLAFWKLTGLGRPPLRFMSAAREDEEEFAIEPENEEEAEKLAKEAARLAKKEKQLKAAVEGEEEEEGAEEGVEEEKEEGSEFEEEIDPDALEGEEGEKTTIRKTVEYYPTVFLDDSKALETLTREFELLKKSPNYGPFSFHKKLDEVTDEELSRLQNEAFETYGSAKEMRGRIGNLVRSLQEENFPEATAVYAEIEDYINTGFSNGDYKIIFDSDFEFLSTHKGFIPYMKVLFNKRYIDENPTIYTDKDFVAALYLVIKDPTFMPILELARFIKPSRESRVAASQLQKPIDQFLKQYGNSNQYNYLFIIHHLFSTLKGTALQSIDFNLFAQKLVNICWGTSFSKSEIQRFHNQLHNVLFVRLNIQENQTLAYYLADMFLTAPTYEEGLRMTGLTLIIINRFLNEADTCNDLYLSFVQNFGQDKFHFYIKEKLPAVLALARKKKLVDLCKQSANNFLSSNIKSEAEAKPVVLDLLDQNFFRKNSKIIYSHENNNPLDYDTIFNQHKGRQEAARTNKTQNSEEKIEQLNKVLYSDDPRQFIRLFWEECQQDQEAKSIFLAISQDYVSDPKTVFHLSDRQAHGFLSALAHHLDQSFGEILTDLFINKSKKKPVITFQKRNENFNLDTLKPAAQVQPKMFSNFVGAKPNAEAPELTQSSKKGFSTGAEKPDEKKSSPFKDFLKKAEEIDQVVKEQRITQEGLEKMKKTLFDEEKKKQKADNEIKFSQIKTPKAAPTQPKTNLGGQAQRTYVLAPGFWENIIHDRTEPHQIIAAIENSFLTSTDVVKTQNAIHNFITQKPLNGKGVENHKVVFYKMFNQPSLKKADLNELQNSGIHVKPQQLDLEPSSKLHLDFETNFGQVVKDYNKYLGSTLFHYDLGDDGYKCLLEVLKGDYKRRYFKKCISHMARFSQDISLESLELIADICHKQKAGLTLLESTHLLIMNGQLSRPEQLDVIMKKLRLFKDLSDSAEQLARSFCHYTGLPFSVEFLGPHLDLLMKFGKKERFMAIFDKLKDHFNTRKLKYDESLSAEENLKLQDKFKLETKQNLAQLYREYIEKLNSHNIYTFSKLLLKEQEELKLSSSSQDYLNSMKINRENQEELEKILDIVKESKDLEFTRKAFDTIIEVVFQSGRKIKTIMKKILDVFIFSHKIELTRDNVHTIAQAMTKTTDASTLDRFVRFLETDGPPLKYATKVTFLRLLNVSEETDMKSQRLAIVENLYSKDVQQKVIEREEKRQQRKVLGEAQPNPGATEKAVPEKFTPIVEPPNETKPVEKTEAGKAPAQEEATAEGEQKESKKKAKKGKGKEQAGAEAERLAKEAETKAKVSQTLKTPENLTTFLIQEKQPKVSKGPAKRLPGLSGSARVKSEAFKEIAETMKKFKDNREAERSKKD